MNSIFEAMVSHASFGLIAFDAQLKCLYLNQRGKEILEYAPSRESDPDQLDLSSLFGDQQRADQHGLSAFGLALLEQEGLHTNVLMQKLNGHAFLAQVALKFVDEPHGRIKILSFQDVTIERKMARELTEKQSEIERAYKELLEQNQQLKELDQAKDKFIALTTHELRTPLSAILATSEVLQMKLYESDEQRDQFIQTIAEQGQHLMELVNDILDFAKIRAGKMEFYVEQIELGPLIEKLTKNYHHMAEQAQVKLHVPQGMEGDSQQRVWVDVLRFKEVFNNVLSNAIKYNRVGGEVFLRLKKLEGANGKSLLRLTCQDTGMGIPEDKISSVFNEFETVGHVSKHHKGTGLGMPISLRLMEQMGGHLSLNSQVGVGSEFHIDIPIDKVLEEKMYQSRPDRDEDLAA